MAEKLSNFYEDIMNKDTNKVKTKGKIFLYFLVLLISTIIISSCATTVKYEAKFNTWIGYDVNEIITSWGPPSNEYTLPNGNKMYTWLWIGNTLATSNYNEYFNMTLTQVVTYWCKSNFTANKLSRIIT
jgi:anaerobic C4-dicarboxylate transporter